MIPLNTQKLNLEALRQYAAPTVRIAMSLVFLYFGISQLIDASMWAGFVPPAMSGMMSRMMPGMIGATAPGAAQTIIYLNGALEVALGTLLFLGFFTRTAAFILAIHLFGIASTIGLSDPTGARDYGLALATFAVFLNGSDQWCLSENIGKKIRGKRR